MQVAADQQDHVVAVELTHGGHAVYAHATGRGREDRS